MANTFYYKIDGDTLYYSDINEDGTWTQSSLDNGGNVPSCRYARPFKAGLAIPYDISYYYHPFNLNTYEEIDFSGFDCITTNDIGILFKGNPNLKHVIFGNHLPKSKGDYNESIFAGCGGDTAEELTVEGTVTLNGGELGPWFAFSSYKRIKFKDFIVNYNNAWNFSDSALWYNDVLEQIDFSGIETTGTFNLKVELKSPVFNTLILPTYSKTRATYQSTSKITPTVETITIKGDLTGLKSFSGMFSNLNSNVLDISNLKYDDDISNLDSAFQNLSCQTIYATKNIFNGQSIEGYRPFEGSGNLVGGNGSAYSTYGNGGQYARIDGGSENPGYFTMGTPEYNCVVDVIPADAATVEWRQERDEFTFSIVSNPGYTFNYFYYKTPGGEYGEKVKNINQCRIPITDGGTYIAYFRYQKTGENPYDPNNPGGGTVPIDDLPSDNTPIETGIDKIEDMLDQYKTNNGRGVYKIYVPTITQFQGWIEALYSENIAEAIKNLGRDMDGIQDMILGYNILPVPIASDGTQNITFNCFGDAFNLLFGGVVMDFTNKKTINFSLGSIKIDRIWHNHLDYAPYTNIEIYLPFIGTRTLDNDDVMNKTLTIDYQIELLTGNCTAYIKVDGQVHYQFTGNCVYKIPLASADMGELRDIGTNAMTSFISTAQKQPDSIQAIRGTMELESTGISFAKALANVKPTAGPHSSSVQGNSAFNNLNYAYVIITRRVPDIPTSYGHNYGFPCNKTVKLEDLTGYTEIESIHLDGLPYTDEELKELESIMKGGFII